MTRTLLSMADEVDPQQLAEQLLAQAKAQGVDLVEPDALSNRLRCPKLIPMSVRARWPNPP